MPKDRKSKMAVCVLLMAGAITALSHPCVARAFTLAITSDIHAGGEKVRKIKNRIQYPNQWKNYLPEVLKAGNVILTVGDNINRDSKYYKKLIAATKGYNIIWTKGNHDKEKEFKLLEKKDYFYVDIKNWRIIALDTNERHLGIVDGISAGQLEWLSGALDTDKNVLISMHNPIWNRKTLSGLRDPYRDFYDIINQHSNVKYVVAGHYHTYDTVKIDNGIEYFFIPALTEKTQKGKFVTLELE